MGICYIIFSNVWKSLLKIVSQWEEKSGYYIWPSCMLYTASKYTTEVKAQETTEHR